MAHTYFVPCFSSYLLVTSSDMCAVPQAHEWESLFHKRNDYKPSTAELKLAGITLKQPKKLRKHNIFRQGDKVRNSDVFLLLFLTLHNDRLNLSTNPHNISVMQQRSSFVSLGYLCQNPSSRVLIEKKATVPDVFFSITFVLIFVAVSISTHFCVFFRHFIWVLISCFKAMSLVGILPWQA